MPYLRTASLALVLFAASAAAPAQDWGKAAHVPIALSNFKFEPSTIRLKAHQPYVLRLTSSGGHSFEAKAFFAAAAVLAADRGKIDDGRIELEGGDSVEIRLTAPGPGRYPVRCTHFLHAGFGMTGTIVVS